MLSLAIITEPPTPPLRAARDAGEPEAELELSPEDILATTIHTAYPVREVADAHGGDPGARLRYASARHGELRLRCASLTLKLDDGDGGEVGGGEGGRREVDDSAARARFGHCLWNASVLMAEMVGGEREAPPPGWDAELGVTVVLRSEEERGRWRPRGERVLELGAGSFSRRANERWSWLMSIRQDSGFQVSCARSKARRRSVRDCCIGVSNVARSR
jgi:hypothetical protein